MLDQNQELRTCWTCSRARICCRPLSAVTGNFRGQNTACSTSNTAAQTTTSETDPTEERRACANPGPPFCYWLGGSTLIACEQTGRRCLMMEMGAVYCDVIVSRWEQFTGRKAERVPTEATVT